MIITKCQFCGKAIHLKGKELKHKNKPLACSKKCQKRLKGYDIKSVDISKVRRYYRKRKEDRL